MYSLHMCANTEISSNISESHEQDVVHLFKPSNPQGTDICSLQSQSGVKSLR